MVLGFVWFFILRRNRSQGLSIGRLSGCSRRLVVQRCFVRPRGQPQLGLSIVLGLRRRIPPSPRTLTSSRARGRSTQTDKGGAEPERGTKSHSKLSRFNYETMWDTIEPLVVVLRRRGGLNVLNGDGGWVEETTLIAH